MQVFDRIRQARSDNGKSWLRQLAEIARLRFVESPIGVGEYFDYGMYRTAVGGTELREFIGWRRSTDLDRLLNDNYSRALANDKLLNYLVLRAAGYRIPAPIATFSPIGRQIDGERVLQSTEEVRQFLEGNPYPFYVKPIAGGYGRGVLGVRRKDGERLVLLDGSAISVDDFLKPFLFPPFRGMLFQRPLEAHEKIAALTGSRALSCVRFICFVTPNGPVVHTAFWKVTAGNNMLDNFTHGKFGNCLAAIDIEEGTIVRAISRMGPGGEIRVHPTTEQPLIGFALPHWQEAIALVCSATKHFPGLRLQNWDVALCSEGPVLLELNTESELAVPQAISGRGLMDARLRQILKDIGTGEAQLRRAVAAGPESVLTTPQKT